MDIYAKWTSMLAKMRLDLRRAVMGDDAMPPAEQEQGLVTRVVRLLTRKLVGKNYFVVMDNFFSSVELFKNLYSMRKFFATAP